jgi:hypothetical protein
MPLLRLALMMAIEPLGSLFKRLEIEIAKAAESSSSR